MLELYTRPEHRFRLYVGGPEGEKALLQETMYNKYAPKSDQEHPSSKRTDNFLILEESPPHDLYLPLRLISFLLKEITSLHLEYTEGLIDNSYVESLGEEVSIEDTLLEGITLRDYQVKSVETMLRGKSGIIQVCTGGGKTEIALAFIKYLYDHTSKNMILCVPSTKLLYQTKERALLRGLSEDSITLYGDSNTFDPRCRILVATVQTLSRRLQSPSRELKSWVGEVVSLVMDEAHHCSAQTFYQVVDAISAEYTLGVTAEPFYNDENHLVQDLLVRGLLGPVLYKVTVPMLVARGYLSTPYMLNFHSECPRNIKLSVDWAYVEKVGIVTNSFRNELIARIAVSLISLGKRPLVLIRQVKHGIGLAALISESGNQVALLTGGSNVSYYRDGTFLSSDKDPEMEVARRFTEGDVDVLIGTSVLDEGVDIPAISAVILAGGGKSPIKVVQRLGRSLRPKPNDKTTLIIDFLDSFNVITRSHANKRREVISTLDVKQYDVPTTVSVEDSLRSFSSYFTSITE